jgi:para-aminobenzoate synthetase/4-amino-4-deoxychorismate lyase
MPARALPVRVPLAGSVPAAAAALLVRGDARPFALTGAWAEGGAIVSSEPLVVAGPEEDPFALLDRQPDVEQEGGSSAEPVGGGWFGFLGYGLGARVERVPPGPPRPVPLPPFALAFYDHLLRLDAAGSWWFEALWTEERAEALGQRLETLRARLAEGVREQPVWVGSFAPSAPGAAGHMAAVEECRRRIAAGEIFQANLCLRLEAGFAGDPLDLFARAARAVGPRHGAVVAGEWGAVCSLSPELFLRRRGREVVSKPIKGTASRSEHGRAALGTSAKEHGRAALRADARNADLVRAAFPPGSVTGTPKIQAMRVIAELEATGREAFTGGIGYASPVAGLELSVAIGTLERRGERAWLGVGGGIVADSDPVRELEECMVKARPVIEAAGGRLAQKASAAGVTPAVRAAPGRPVAGRARAVRAVPGRPAAGLAPVRALAGAADRPDPELGVFSTLLVRGGRPIDADAHLARLARSAARLYGRALPDDLEFRLAAAAAPHELARLRVVVEPGSSTVELEAVALPGEPALGPLRLAPAVLPGGLGAHKWCDRRLLADVERRTGAVPLLVDLDGEVLEAAHANVFAVGGDDLVTPPLDGRILPGTVRARLLVATPGGMTAREEPLTLERLRAADEILLASSIRGVHPATLGDPKRARFETGARLRAALAESGEPVEAAVP